MSWVMVNDEQFYLHEGETLLQGLIRQGYAPNYECCQGYCGSCKTKIISKQGELNHTLPPLCLLEEDEVLACCCTLSGHVRLKMSGERQLSLFEYDIY